MVSTLHAAYGAELHNKLLEYGDFDLKLPTLKGKCVDEVLIFFLCLYGIYYFYFTIYYIKIGIDC